MATDLEALDAQLDAAVSGALGNTITYKAGAAAVKTITAFVDHSDMLDSLTGSSMVAQDIEIEVDKTDVPVVTKGDVITLSRTGKTYKVKEWRHSRSGLQWIMRVEVSR
jgi:hypothetical protein